VVIVSRKIEKTYIKIRVLLAPLDHGPADTPAGLEDAENFSDIGAR